MLQRKISNALLYHAFSELLSKEIHIISIKELCHIINYTGNNYDVIKDALRDLISIRLEWNLVDDETGEEEWTASTILASVQLKGAVCSFSYSAHMRLLLSNPQMYGTINMIVQSKFKSSYGLALYENCIRYRNLPQTKWLDMGLFRHLMGIPDDKYLVFRDLKRRVIDKAVDEINMYSDLTVEPEIKRVGRKATAIRFKLKHRPKKIKMGSAILAATSSSSEDVKRQSIKKELISVFKMGEAKANQLLDTYSTEQVGLKLNMIYSMRLFKEDKIQNLAGYLIAALRDDFQLTKKAQQTKPQRQLDEEKLRHQELEERLRVDYERYIEVYVKAYYLSLDEAARESLSMKFLNSIKGNGLIREAFLQEGLNNYVVLSRFVNFARTTQKELLAGSLSFKAYCEAERVG